MSSVRISEFATWQAGYGLAEVQVKRANTDLLADLYTDVDLTEPAFNPVTLLEKVENGISYGRFSEPLYTNVAYELEINQVDRTGVVQVPISDLDGEDVSGATVRATGGAVDVTLADVVARTTHVLDHGTLTAVDVAGASAATNNATVVVAIGAAAAAGGGFVDLPPGDYQVEAFTIPEGVTLRGVGIGATVLQSLEAGNVIEIAGDRAGLTRLTLDGVSQVVGSLGVKSLNRDEVVLDQVEIKRFETGLFQAGGQRCDWRDFSVSDCAFGANLFGNDAAGSGGELRNNQWRGGTVELCSGAGIQLENANLACEQQLLEGILFDTNTGIALNVIGARGTTVRNCEWSSNTAALQVNDTSPASDSNTVIGLVIEGGKIDGGFVNLTGTLEQVVLRRLELANISVTLTTPGHNLLIEDCRETEGVVINGVATAWLRHNTGDRGSSSGVTTSNTATKAWSIALVPGERVYLEAKVIGRARNTTDSGYYHFTIDGKRPAATLAYDTQLANFTLGAVATGATSGATGRIVADADAGATGTLSLQDVEGTFVDNETLTDTSGGSALVNGTLATSACTVGTATQQHGPIEDDATWAAAFVANGPEIELRVTGAAGKTIEWLVDVDVVSN